MARKDDRAFVQALNAYESKPQTKIDDKVSPFRGATPAKAATAADLAQPVAPAGAPSTLHDTDDSLTAAAVAATDDDTPVVDEDGSLTGDPTDSGEGTSDELTDSSTVTADPSGEPDPNADLTGEDPAPEGDEDNLQAPKKGSAAERIVEVLDLMEGYKIFGKAKEDQVKALQAELERLRPTPVAVAAPAIVEEKDEPMPDMSDADIGFDNDKYREKMARWVKAQGRIEARREMRAERATQVQQSVVASIETKIAKFEETHSDFKEKVRENKILATNQLHPIAGRLVQKSDYTADLLYAFGNDVAHAVRVAKMDPEDQVLAINDMIAKIKKAPVKSTSTQVGAKSITKKSITQAPPPPRATLAAGRSATRDTLDPGMGMDEFARQHRSGKQNAREQNRKQRGLS